MDQTDRISQLERLQRLREAGALTDAEFAHEKSLVLGYAPEAGEPRGRRRTPLILGCLVLAVVGGLVLAATIMPATKMAHATIVHRHTGAALTSAGPAEPTSENTDLATGDDRTAEIDPLPATSRASPAPALLTRWIQLETECDNDERRPESAACQVHDEAAKALQEARGLLKL